MSSKTFSFSKAAFSYQRQQNMLERLNFDILEGESVCLLGANGSGKSTLLKLMGALLFVSEGHLQAFGDEITENRMENGEFARSFYRRIGIVFQNSDAQLFNSRVWDELAFGPLQMNIAASEVKHRVQDVLQMLGLEGLQDRSPHHLSGGEKKKVALASVLILNPSVLVLDEPTNGLDPRSARWLTDFLLEFKNLGRTIIIATHNLELAHALSERALVLSEDHRLVFDGPAQLALNDNELLREVNLIDEYTHVHEGRQHVHRYIHG